MQTNALLTPEIIKEYLQEVKDPEIPTISVVDLGVITEININGDLVQIEMIPTFSGCPAIHFMRLTIEEVLKEKGVKNVVVEVNRNKRWSSNYVTERGRQQLLDFGLSPPPVESNDLENDLKNALCPKCGSTNTQLLSPFGPTLCRAIHHCHNCAETFEQFKPL